MLCSPRNKCVGSGHMTNLASLHIRESLLTTDAPAAGITGSQLVSYVMFFDKDGRVLPKSRHCGSPRMTSLKGAREGSWWGDRQAGWHSWNCAISATKIREHSLWWLFQQGGAGLISGLNKEPRLLEKAIVYF